MSYIKIKNISFKKNGEITITGASNNVRPLTYSTFTFKGDKKDLLLTLLDGSGQLNDSVYNFKYAMYKLQELENYRELKDDIDNFKWDFNDIKRYYYTGKTWKKNEIKLEKVTDDYILLYEYEDYKQYMEKAQYEELKTKYENAIETLSNEFYKYVDEKHNGKYVLYSDKIGYVTKKKSYFTYSMSDYSISMGDYKKIYCEFKRISQDNVDYYGIYIKEVEK